MCSKAASVFNLCSHYDFHMRSFVLHCKPIFWGHVHWLPRQSEKVQFLDKDSQEEVDFISCNGLANAAALSHAKNHHFLPLQLVDRGAISAQKTVWVEGKWIFPHLAEMCKEKKIVISCKNKNPNKNTALVSVGDLISFSLYRLAVGCKRSFLLTSFETDFSLLYGLGGLSQRTYGSWLICH